MMDFSKLQYIKNVNDKRDWAYKECPKHSYFPLTFNRGDTSDEVEAHACKLSKGSLIILSQRYPSKSERYLTHVVELCNEHHEDKSQWDSDPWGVIRWVKVCWVADFSDIDTMPVDQDVMQAEWGWYDTKAKLLESPSLMKKWNSIGNLREHLEKIFIEVDTL